MNEHDQLHIACVNSYRVLVLDEDWLKIFGESKNYFAHNPIKRVTDNSVLESLLIYFTHIEDYDKCIQIQKKIKKNTS